MKGEYVWRPGPLISAPPEKIIKYRLEYDGKSPEDFEVTEVILFLLENKKYLYISYNGLVADPNSGIGHWEEVDLLDEGLEIFG